LSFPQEILSRDFLIFLLLPMIHLQQHLSLSLTVHDLGDFIFESTTDKAEKNKQINISLCMLSHQMVFHVLFFPVHCFRDAFMSEREDALLCQH
jgi:signal transduction histidine kinase